MMAWSDLKHTSPTPRAITQSITETRNYWEFKCIFNQRITTQAKGATRELCNLKGLKSERSNNWWGGWLNKEKRLMETLHNSSTYLCESLSLARESFWMGQLQRQWQSIFWKRSWKVWGQEMKSKIIFELINSKKPLEQQGLTGCSGRQCWQILLIVVEISSMSMKKN